MERFIGQIREELVTGEYLPLDAGDRRYRRTTAIRDRVVQGVSSWLADPRPAGSLTASQAIVRLIAALMDRLAENSRRF